MMYFSTRALMDRTNIAIVTRHNHEPEVYQKLRGSFIDLLHMR